MNQPAQRDQILRLAAQNQSYLLLQAALPWLGQHADDHEVRLSAVGQLARLGLFGPAVELIDEGPAGLRSVPDVAKAAEAFRSQPSGQVAWSACAARLKRQWRVIVDRWPEAAQHEAALAVGLAEIELYRCADGNWLLSRKPDGRSRQWLPNVVDWAGIVRQAKLVPSETATVCYPYALDGVGFGHALREVYEGTREMLVDFTPRIHVFELNLAQLAAWLSVDEAAETLRSERVHLWLGPAALEGYEAFYDHHQGEIAPHAVVRLPGWGAGAQTGVNGVVQRVRQRVAEREEVHRGRVQAMLVGREAPAFYAAAFADRKRGRPLRVLGVTSRHTTFLQYSMRDIGHAVEALGHEFELVIEESAHTPTVPRDEVLRRIADFGPHLIVILDHNRKEYGELYDRRIPFCNWIQDDLPHLFGPGKGAGLAPYDVVVGTIGSWRARQSGYPDDQWLALRTPVSTRMFSPEPVAGDDLKRCACDLSFVSNQSIEVGRFVDARRATAPSDEYRRLMEALYEMLGPRIAAGDAPGSRVQTNALTRELAATLGFVLSEQQADQLRQAYTDRLISLLFRHQVLEWASDMGLDVHVYGRGWEDHPRLGRHARGVAEHGYHLRTIFQASRLNLQAFPYSAIHQRLFEGLASGGFFVIRRTPHDTLSELIQRIEQRAIALDLTTEEALWNTDDAALAADVRALNEAMYAPGRLYDGYAADLRISAGWPVRYEAGALLPEYEHVSFGTRAEFEHVVGAFLDEPQRRREVAMRQREMIVRYFSYEAALEQVFDFLERRFARLSAEADRCDPVLSCQDRDGGGPVR